MSSENDSYNKPSRKVTRVLGQTDPWCRNNGNEHQPGSPSGQAGCTSNSPQWRVRPNKQSNSPARRVGLNEQSNSPAQRVGPNEQSNSPNGRVGYIEQAVQLANGRVGRTSSQTPPHGELDQLTYLCPVLVVSFFEIGSNLLLFHLDCSAQELVISYEIRIDRIKQ